VGGHYCQARSNCHPTYRIELLNVYTKPNKALFDVQVYAQLTCFYIQSFKLAVVTLLLVAIIIGNLLTVRTVGFKT
jgi:hypothetical protein